MTKAGRIDRHYGLDWLRIGAFLLLILYHIGLYFSNWHWLVKSAVPVDWISYPMLFATSWRLTLLFIVSGYASCAMLMRLDGIDAFVRVRSLRLLVPLAFAMATIIAPQGWVRLSFLGFYNQDFLTFWLHDYFRFGTLHGVTLPEWEHLWFIAYLWAYTMVLAVLLAWLPAGWRAGIGRWFESFGDGWRLLWLPLGIFIPLRIVMTFTISETHGLFDDWIGHAMYLPPFLFGFGLAATPSLWRAIARVWQPALVLSLIAYAALAWVDTLYPGTAVPPHGLMALGRAAQVAMMWAMSLALLHAAQTLFNHDHRWRATLSEAVFPIYIVHQTAIVLIGWWMQPFGLSNAAQFGIMITGTALCCWTFYAAGARIMWLRPLIGLSAGRPAPRVDAVSAPA